MPSPTGASTAAILRRLLSPPPRRHAGQWGEENRRLPDGSPVGRRLNLAAAPYLVPVFEAVADPAVSTVVLVCAAQMGKTELILNVIGWTLDDNPRPIIYLSPTRKLAVSVMKSRIDQLIRSVPALAERVDQRRGYDTTLEKYIAGQRLGVAWAGSKVEVISHPTAVFICDERDAMEDDIKGIGDPVLAGKARTKNFRNGTTIVTSCPSIEGSSPILDEWAAGSKEIWHFRCKACGDWYRPRAELLSWPKSATPDEAAERAELACDHCGTLHDEHDRLAARGRFFPVEITDEGDYRRLDVAPSSASRSFWVSGLASQFTPMRDLAFLLCEVYRQRDPEKIQTCLNQFFGEPYKLEGDSPGVAGVKECRLSYDVPPAGCQLITAGIDPGAEYIYYTIRGWGWPNATSWKLEHGILYGDTDHDEVWIALGQILQRRYGGRPVKLALVDSGFSPGDKAARPEHAVYRFCRRTPNALPSKGAQSLDRPHKLSKPDVRRTGKVAKGRGALDLWWVNTHHWKQWLYARIRWPKSEPGAWYISHDTDESYMQQVTNEELIKLPSGRFLWKRTGSRENHLLDCEVLAAVAAHVENVMQLPPPSAAAAARVRRGQAPDPSLERGSL